MAEQAVFESKSGKNDATRRQRYALFCITKKDFRDVIISKEEASDFIKSHNEKKSSAFSTFEKLYEEADKIAKEAVENSGKSGGIGFAWIMVKPKDCPFAQWLKSKSLGGVNDFQKAYSLFVGDYGQDLLKKEEYAHTFASVLRNAGIDASADSRMD